VNHFLITRWNLPGALQASGLERVTDSRWRARRRELFELYCLPSVARQTVADFSWLFLVSEGLTPEADVHWFQAHDERLRIVPVEDPESSGSAEARNAVSGSVSGDDWVITTRLDSDDILHPDHLRRVRVAHGGKRQVVEFINGFYYDVRRDSLRRVREPQNAFVSVLEPANDLRTALGWGHHEIGLENEILYLEEPGWIALVHDHNALTYLWGDRVPSSTKREVLTEFGVRRPPFVQSRLRRLEAQARRGGHVAGRVARRVFQALGT
jgi:hypothetical protein